MENLTEMTDEQLINLYADLHGMMCDLTITYGAPLFQLPPEGEAERIEFNNQLSEIYAEQQRRKPVYEFEISTAGEW